MECCQEGVQLDIVTSRQELDADGRPGTHECQHGQQDRADAVAADEPRRQRRREHPPAAGVHLLPQVRHQAADAHADGHARRHEEGDGHADGARDVAPDAPLLPARHLPEHAERQGEHEEDLEEEHAVPGQALLAVADAEHGEAAVELGVGHVAHVAAAHLVHPVEHPEHGGVDDASQRRADRLADEHGARRRQRQVARLEVLRDVGRVAQDRHGDPAGDQGGDHAAALDADPRAEREHGDLAIGASQVHVGDAEAVGVAEGEDGRGEVDERNMAVPHLWVEVRDGGDGDDRQEDIAANGDRVRYLVPEEHLRPAAIIEALHRLIGDVDTLEWLRITATTLHCLPTPLDHGTCCPDHDAEEDEEAVSHYHGQADEHLVTSDAVKAVGPKVAWVPDALL